MIKKSAEYSIVLAFALWQMPAYANSVGENAPWQFQTTSEMANQAYIEELRRKNASGAFQAPQYNYYIDTQNNFNCSNSANSSGNGGSNAANANTPSSSGATGSALGNQTSSSGSAQGLTGDVVLNSGQDNSGPVVTSVTGDSFADASNNLSRQVLNTMQTNTGLQDASVVGSNGCSFATPAGFGGQ
jgi:hypothetical protein